MVTKKYVSGTCPSFEAGGKRVRFEMLTLGGSYFITSDEKLQAAIEKHPWFGDKIALDSVMGAKDETPSETSDEDETEGGLDHPYDGNDKKAEDGTQESEAVEMAEGGSPEVMEFDTLADAKEWIVSQFGVAPSRVKTKADAINIAEKLHVTLRFK